MQEKNALFFTKMSKMPAQYLYLCVFLFMRHALVNNSCHEWLAYSSAIFFYSCCRVPVIFRYSSRLMLQGKAKNI